MSEEEAKAELKAAKAKAKSMRPWYKKKRFWALGAISIIIITQVANGGSESTSPSSTSSTSTSTDQEEVTTETNNSSESVSQANAKRGAETYLDSMGFSRKGLIKQLEFEGYSKEDATYGVDSLNADWKEQAVRVGKQYLDSMAFSRKSLITQLEFDGFSKEEAEYGATQNGL